MEEFLSIEIITKNESLYQQMNHPLTSLPCALAKHVGTNRDHEQHMNLRDAK